MDKMTLEQSEMPCREDADGLTLIGGFTVCSDGLKGKGGRPRRPVSREQVEIAKEFFSGCRRTRWARKWISPSAMILSDVVTNGFDYDYIGNISVGAIVVAALELGIVCLPEGERDALIGVNIDDACARTTMELLIGRKAQDEAWQEYAKEGGLATDSSASGSGPITTPSPREGNGSELVNYWFGAPSSATPRSSTNCDRDSVCIPALVG